MAFIIQNAAQFFRMPHSTIFVEGFVRQNTCFLTPDEIANSSVVQNLPNQYRAELQTVEMESEIILTSSVAPTPGTNPGKIPDAILAACKITVESRRFIGNEAGIEQELPRLLANSRRAKRITCEKLSAAGWRVAVGYLQEAGLSEALADSPMGQAVNWWQIEPDSGQLIVPGGAAAKTGQILANILKERFVLAGKNKS